jgi:hypothetical protein
VPRGRPQKERERNETDYYCLLAKAQTGEKKIEFGNQENQGNQEGESRRYVLPNPAINRPSSDSALHLM